MRSPASRAGDFDALLEVLDPDVVFRVHAGAASPQARGPINGGPAVARQILARGTRLASLARHAIVNGSAGVVVGPPGGPIAVVGFTVARGRILAIDLLTDPPKLRGLAAMSDNSGTRSGGV